MPALYTNQATSTLAAGISNTDTTLSVQAGHGARFPSITGSDYFLATIDNGQGSVEIVRVTARSTDTFTIVRAQDGTSAFTFSAGAVVEIRVTRALLDAIKADVSVSIQDFSTVGSSTWTKPAGAKWIQLVMYGGGGGGGSGRCRAGTNLQSTGGAGGGPGARVEVSFPASSVGATVTVTVGAGGLGAAGQTVGDTNGNQATENGGTSSFGSFAARGGIAGFAGGTTSQSGPSSGGLYPVGTSSGTNIVTGQAGFVAGGATVSAAARGALGGGGGGSGGGYANGSTIPTAGGAGGGSGSIFLPQTDVNGGGGAGGSVGNAGSNGADSQDGCLTGGAGAGGGAAGFPGGNGGFPGAGGGGGGASTGGAASAAGGTGGKGFVRVVTFF